MNLAREIQQKYKIGETNFAEWNLYRQNLSFQTLDGSDFSKADLTYANLSSASFKKTSFHFTNLSFANCFKADFSEADLTGANLTAASLSEANFLNAIYDEKTLFPQGFDAVLAGAILQSQVSEPNIESTKIQEIPPPEIQEDSDNEPFIQESDKSFNIELDTISFDRDSEPDKVIEGESDNPIEREPNHNSVENLRDSVDPDLGYSSVDSIDRLESEDLPKPTVIVSPAPEVEEQSSNKVASPRSPNKRRIFLIVLIALFMPILGGGAYLLFRVYETFQQEQSILKAVKTHRDNQDFDACLEAIIQAEDVQFEPTPFSNFVDQLETIKGICQEKFAAQQMKKGSELINKEEYDQAIATLSTIPDTTESYGLAQSQITMAGRKYCDELDIDARKSSNEDQFYALLAKGENLPTEAAIANECKNEMFDLRQKWDENIPMLNDAEALLNQGDCDAVRSRSKSLGKSIFRKWQRTSEQLLEDVADCQVPINITSTLRDKTTHTFKGITGQSLTIELSSRDFDTVVTLLDSNGNQLGKNDDIRGSNKNSLLKLPLKQTGEFTVKVSAYKNKGTGTYSLKVSR